MCIVKYSQLQVWSGWLSQFWFCGVPKNLLMLSLLEGRNHEMIISAPRYSLIIWEGVCSTRFCCSLGVVLVPVIKMSFLHSKLAAREIGSGQMPISAKWRHRCQVFLVAPGNESVLFSQSDLSTSYKKSFYTILNRNKR